MTKTNTKPVQGWRLIGRGAVMPIVAVGLLGLAPWQMMGVFARWQALAQTPPATRPAAPAPQAARPAPPPEASPAAQRPPDGKLLEELNRRTAELDAREQNLRTWATQIAAAERLARAQLAELGQMRTELEKVLAKESAASDADIAVLVGLYSNMKPSQAAVLLGRLDSAMAAAILEKLDIHSAGPALASMEPTVAVAITEELSRRHAPFRK